jgi:hypothetical protein
MLIALPPKSNSQVTNWLFSGYWIGGPLICLVVGYAILISVDSIGARYFACFIVVMGIYPTTGMSLMWLNDNVAQHFKRATMIGATLTCANTAGVAVGQIFTTESSPRYIKGLSISLGLAILAGVMVRQPLLLFLICLSNSWLMI